MRVLSRIVPAFSILGLLAVGASLMADDENLVAGGDFEQPVSADLPPGWTMWGAQKYKIASNYTRDTSQAHSGQACFRIDHPAGTEGYVVSSPETALRPKEGMRYTLTFWARSDRPGEALFGWTAYRSIRPFVEAASPGLFPIRLDRDWREFRFLLDEGWDFFAEDCRFMLLTFKAAGRPEEQRTLWIDDVVVTERPSPREGRLVNPESLVYDRLDHRLKPGDELKFTVDAGRRQREAPREVGGVSFHRVAGYTKLPFDKDGRYVLPPDLEEAVRNLRLPMTRFYALGDEPFGLEAAIDKAAEFLNRIGTPQAATPLEFEIQGATSKLLPEVWARGVRHSLDRGYEFRRWEITNEPYVGRVGRAFQTADSYLEHFLSVSRAIRQVHPSGQIGMPIHHRSPAWGNYLLKRAAGDYDFIVGHYYCSMNVQRSSFEDVVLTANYQMIDEILKVNALMRLYNPDREVYQYDTEWGMHSSGPQGERADYVRRNANIFGMMHRAVRLIHYLREAPLRGASSWEMFSHRSAPGFGFLAQDDPQLRSMTYWLYYYFNRHAGRWVLPIDGTAPYYEGTAGEKTCRGPLTPAVATLSDDGSRLFVILADGSWTRAVPCRIEFRGFTPQQAAAVVLSHSDPDGDPFIRRKEDLVNELKLEMQGPQLTTQIPPHAVVFITLRRSGS
ncbi:MAG: hypothetical protein GXX96_19435 [Planctomycetaceae bacterium]|nr:hypothetical protein [Planctomycetaceae bacterium]